MDELVKYLRDTFTTVSIPHLTTMPILKYKLIFDYIFISKFVYCILAESDKFDYGIYVTDSSLLSHSRKFKF